MDKISTKMQVKKFLFILITLSINYQQGLSQNLFSKKQLYVEGFYHYGIVAPHHDYIAYFVNERVKGFQINVGYYTIGNKYWNKDYNYPRIGIGFYKSGLGNKAIYGELNALYMYFDRSFLNLKNRVNIGNKIAFGVGHISKTFDLYSNNLNVVIGSKYNVFIQYNLESSVRVSPMLKLKMGISLMHTSNGSIKQPNNGLNLVTSFVGLQYSLSDQSENLMTSIPKNADTTKHQFLVTSSFGWKSISRLHAYEYPVYGISFEYSRKVSNTSWLGLSLTGYLDKSIKKEFEIQLYPDSTVNSSVYQSLALNTSYELRAGRLAFILQPGIYIKYSFKPYGIITNKMGLRYYFKYNLVGSMSIKSHWVAKADFIEWGLGYRFNR